jgi:microcystin-dependent protein
MLAKLKPQRNHFRLLNVPTGTQPSLSSDIALLYNWRFNNPTAINGYKIHFRVKRLDLSTGAISQLSQLHALIATDPQEPEADMVGAIQNYAGNDTPAGWLECDGSAISRTTYAALYAIIGTAYGVGNGTTTYNLPDLRGRTPIGAGQGTGGGQAGSGKPTGGLGLVNRTRGDWLGTEAHQLAATESGIAQHNHANTAVAADTATEAAHTHAPATPGYQDLLYKGTAGGGVAVSAQANTVTTETNSGAGSAHKHTAGAITVTNADAGPTIATNSHQTMQPSTCIRFLIKT